MPTTGIRIGELMKRSGVTRATVHHYVREGLLPEPTKTSRNMALYAPDCVDRVLLIKNLQNTRRLSLREVRDLLDKADGHEGLARLRNRVDAAAISGALRMDEEPEPLDVDAVATRSGFVRADLEEFAAAGLIGIEGDAVADYDVGVVDALARLREAGFDKEHGFEPTDAKIYLDALQQLLHKEVEIFLARSSRTGEDPEALVMRAEQGVKGVTPLLLAFRRKVIRELIDKLPLPARKS